MCRLTMWKWDPTPQNTLIQKGGYGIGYMNNGNVNIAVPERLIQGDSEAIVRGALLIHLLETKIITAAVINKRIA